MSNDHIDTKKVFINSLRLFFAPLVGAYRGVVHEFYRLQDEHTQ